MGAKRSVLVGISVLVVVVAACGPVKKGTPHTFTFGCTGTGQNLPLPADVRQITIVAFGAEGGSFEGDMSGGPFVPGGRGAGASGTYPINPELHGPNLFVIVGCEGESTLESDGVPGQGGFGSLPRAGGGFGGGGDGGSPTGAGGGGTSLVLHARGGFLAAAGGGGAGGGLAGGNAGGAGGYPDGGAGGTGAQPGCGGGGGTQSTGGAAGIGGGSPATPGEFDQGGDGGDAPKPPGGGGGGGNGFHGGGGGCAAGGGGGGSSFGIEGTTFESGVWGFGDGLIMISYRTSS